MKKFSDIFDKVAFLLILNGIISTCLAQSPCITVYKGDESCMSEDGWAKVVFMNDGGLLANTCVVSWIHGDEIFSTANRVDGLSKGIYRVKVSSTVCTDVVYFDELVEIGRNTWDCGLKVRILGDRTVTGSACNTIPEVEYSVQVLGGESPYHYQWMSGAETDNSTFTYHPEEGEFYITCKVTDNNGAVGFGSLTGFAKKMECAQDPNEIKGPNGYLDSVRFVNTTDRMRYNIDFENDPDFATAPASRVKITYDVPAHQNISSFRLSDFGFGNFIYTVPSNATSYTKRLDVSDSLGVWVDVTAGIDIVNHQLFWIFQSIDPATGAEPSSSQMGFLPINDSLERGQGYVSFSILPAANLHTGDTVSAEALIVFDDNAPIGTNVWKNTFDAVAPASTLQVETLAQDSLYCNFSFVSTDDPSGSGVRQVEVFVSTDNSTYTSIGTAHPDSMLSYALENGVIYNFMSIATDNVGNIEAFKTSPDTTVNYNSAPTDLMLSGNTFYEYDPINTTIGTFYTIDNDINLPFVYELVPGQGDSDNNLFTIVANTLKTNALFACANQSEYSIRVRTTDIGGLSLEKSFEIHEIMQHTIIETNMRGVICVGDTFLFNNQQLVSAGYYTDTLTTALGCDSIVNLYLTVNQPSTGDTMVVACDNYIWYDSVYTQSGDYIRILTNVVGCDSIVTLHLTVNHTTYGDTTAIACDSFDWYEQTGLTESGDYTHTLTNAAGCDSVVTLHLTVNHTTYGDTIAIACNSFDWYEHTGLTESDDYMHTLTNAAGCDSVVTLHLTVNATTYGDTTAIACNSFNWYGQTGLTVSGDYTHTLTNAAGCDSVVTLHLTVNHTTYGDTTAIACDSFDWYEQTGLTVSGDYTHTLTNTAGCDSVVTLHLTMNHTTYGDTTAIACNSFDWHEHTGITQSCENLTHTFTNANGCDSVVTLHLTVNHTTYGDTTAIACNSFNWYGTTYTSSGDYSHTLTNANGCDSIVTLHLTVNATTYGDTTAIACNSFNWYEQMGLTVSGDYTHTLTNAAGCDSVVTLHLTVNHTTYGDTTAIACDSFDWYEQTGLTVSGEYTHTLTNAAGCDSIVTLHLTVNYSNTGDTTAVACDSYDWHGTTYTQSGNYTHTLTNAVGCDSVVTLHLTVNHTTYGDTTAIACDSYDWYEQTGLTVSGNYTHTLTNAAGCDSVVTMHLTVNHTTYGDTTAIACDSFDWYEQTGLTESGDYTHTLTNAAGCDSIVTLHLTVNHTTYGDTTAIACDSYDWYEQTGLIESGDYTHTLTNTAGCDSIVTLHLTIHPTVTKLVEVTACGSYTWNNIVYTESGNYERTFTSVNGCDSIVTLHLTINHGDYTEVSVDTCGTDYYWALADTTVNQSGTYYYYGTNANTCTDTSVLMLTLYQSATTELTAQICAGEVYDQNGFNTSTAGDHQLNLQTAHGCDSVVILHLTVGSEAVTYLAASICEGDSYNENGFNIITPAAGIHEYSDTIHRLGTCDSVVTLHLTVNHRTYGDTIAIACNSFDWYGNTYASSGNYTHTLTNAAGCDSIVTLHLTIHHGDYTEVSVDTCGTDYYWALADITVSQSGTYFHYSTNANTCTDTAVLMLTLYQPAMTELTAQICAGEVYAQNGFNTSTAGDHYLNLQTTHGCDSVVILHLTVGSEAVTYLAASICEGDSYQENGFEIFSPAVGVYEYSDTIGRVGTCDSIVVLTLTVNAATSGDTTAVVNSSFDWYGQHLTTSGDYTSTLTNVAGCDSVVTLHLTVNYSGTGDTTAIACDEFDWYEHMNLTQSGDYTHTFTNIAGGDSVVTLHLTVNHSVTEIVEATACGNYTWNDIVYTESGDYERTFTSANGCDSTVVLHLTVFDLPELSMIQGEPVICRNQYSMYFYDITNSDYNYYWYHNSQFLAGNVPSVVLYEENSGTHTLMMQVEDVLNGCYADTSMSILVQNALAPDTTVIMRKNNTNILICSEVSSEYGTVHYRWGYTNLFTHEETIMEGDYNYCMFDIGIDLQSYVYWVETYIQYADGVGCANRTYYGHSIYTDIADYEYNTIDARVVNNQLFLHVDAAASDMIDVILYGINGQLLLTQHYGSTDQVNDILPFQYSNGLYLLIVRVGNQVYPVKLLKY